MFNAPIKDTNTINLKDAARDMGDGACAAANMAGRKVRGMLHNAGDEIAHAGEYMGTEIRSNPVRSSMIALGVGVLLGALLRK